MTGQPPPALLSERRGRVMGAGARQMADVVLVLRPEHVRYVCGQDAAAVLLAPDRGAVIAPRTALDASRIDRQGLELIEFAAYDVGRLVDPVVAAAASVDALLVAWRPRTVGCDVGGMRAPIASLRDVDVVDMDPAFATLRRPRDAWEIDELRGRVTIVERGLAAARDAARAGLSELDVFAAISRSLAESLGRPVRLDHNIGSGPRSAQSNPGASTRTLGEGDLLLVDLYPPLDGYIADLCRTWSIGAASETARRLHRSVLDALRTAEAVLGPGVPVAAVDEAVRSSLRRAGELDGSMAHQTGHGLGLFAWEEPWIGPGAAGRFVVGDVIAIEPGAYAQGIGGVRIEGNYLITENGFERLDSMSEGLLA